MKKSPKLSEAIASDARTLLDLQNETDRLKQEADYWRKRAMVARAGNAKLLKDLNQKEAAAIDAFAITVVTKSCLYELARDVGLGDILLLQRLLEDELLTDTFGPEPVLETAPSAKSDVGATSLAVSLREQSITRLLTCEFKRRPAARSTIAGVAVFMLKLEGHAELAELFAQLLGIRNEANRTVKPVLVAFFDGIDARRGRPQRNVRIMSQVMNVSVGSISAWRRARLHQKIVKKVVSYPAPAGAGADWKPALRQVHQWPRRAACPSGSVQSSEP